MLRIISLFLIVLFLSASFARISRADESFRVLEDQTRFALGENLSTVSLAVENPSGEFSAGVKLEILAPNDDVRATRETVQKVGRGTQILTIPVEISDAILKDDALLWYRLRYEINGNSPNAKAGGIISFSQILPEVFELKMISSDPFGEKLFRVRVQAVNPATQNAVTDVNLAGEIKIEDPLKTIKTEAKTDTEGFAMLEFSLPDFKTHSNIDLKITGKKNNLTREVSSDLSGFTGKLAEIVTDKPIYQPNQTVNLRLYSYNLNRLPVKNDELTLEIENEQEEEMIFTGKIKTSRFGIAAAAWKIPEGTKLGNYLINIKNAENDLITSEKIKITRYDLPNFHVEAKPDRAFYLPDQKTARVEINGKYLFGKVLNSSKVRIVSQNRNDDDAEVFPEITGLLNDEGKFSAEIDLSKAFEKFKPNDYQRFKDLRFSVYVTDLTTNRTEPRSFDLRITNEPIHIYLIGDANRQSSRMPLNFYVSTFYADGTPVSGEVGIYELISSDADGKPISPELGKLLTKIKTNSYGAAKLQLPVQLEAGDNHLDLKLVATDGKNLSGSLVTEIDTDDKPAIEVATEKTVYRKGEAVKVFITSSEKSGVVFVDVFKDSQIIYAVQTKLENGHAELVLPYREEFKNSVGIAAYFEEDGSQDLIMGIKSIIYPTPVNLEIEARTPKEIYRPGEQVAVKFRSRNAGKSFAETVLGVLVIDKAVEERARTESETDDKNQFLNRTFVSRMAGFFGQGKVFGDLTVRDIQNLDLSKPLSNDLKLGIEIALGSADYQPHVTRSRAFRDDLDSLFTPFFKAKMKPVSAALDENHAETLIFPTDEKSLREILSAQNIDFTNLRDAWGNAFRAEFRTDKDYLKMTIWSLGADKLPETSDDLSVLEMNWRYFTKVGIAIDKAMRDYTQRTNGFITDYKTLREEMLRQNIDTDAIRDAWGNPYRFEFTIDRTNYVLTVKSDGADKKTDILRIYNSDDFSLWTNRTDYFTVTKANLTKGFNEYVAKTKTFPRSETEMRNILQLSGFNLDETKDIYNRPFYVQQKETARLANFYQNQTSNLKVVKQKILTFLVKSTGPDGIKGNYDDFELTSFSGATSEEETNLPSTNPTVRKTLRQKSAVPLNGAIGGTVFDPSAAVIANAEVTLTNISRSINRSVKSNDNGEFLIDNLPKDVYSLEISSPGFKSNIVTNLLIEPGILVEIDDMLEVGNVTETVEITSSAPTIETSSSQISSSVTANKVSQIPGITPSFTPRVRDYFAETLVWSPELVTDKKGEATLNFKMADSLTTWKLYAIGSDENGDFGVVEKELQTFQPFFAELDPPRILTEGDRIALPVPIRNYTDKQQKVAVSMTETDWLKISNGATQSIEIPANGAQNAVFDFRAAAPVTDGKQKVTALAKKDADAIEKPVTVRPNGKEIIETKSNLFEKETFFDVNFPASAFPNTRRAEVKIYPNMLAHIAESVDGLLVRPHGCGEQTTSSTYPNLLILKLEKELKKEFDPKIKAQAQNYLEEGYKRLLNYQTDSGFGYWNGDTPDIALTAYVLRFLADAGDFIEVDENVAEKAEKWLLNQQKADGSWESSKGDADVSTAYIARSLSLTARNSGAKTKALQSAIAFLQKRIGEIDDSYVLANLALASETVGDPETVKKATEKLRKLSQPDNGLLYWTAPNTPFNGWGKTADIETTALVLQVFLEQNNEADFASDVSRGLSFLLKNKDENGIWFSTQTTVNVLDALILSQKIKVINDQAAGEKAEIYVNGRKVQEFLVVDNGLSKPLIFDASAFLSQNNNRFEIKGLNALNLTMAQIVSKHYIDWSEVKEDSRYFNLKVDFDKLQAKIGDEITCNVQIQRADSVRYGMLLAEIGLPPGADVDRQSLEKALQADSNLSRYDILPDRVIVYLWASPTGTKFNFRFKPRFGLNAQTAPSVVYDYYNEEAKAMLAPQRFEVK